MSGSPSEFAALLERFRAGDDGAARELCERFGPHLRRAIRRRLDPRLRRQFDSADLSQAVWTSFLAGAAAEQFDDPAAFQAYLNRIATNKIAELFRRDYAKGNSPVRRQRSIDDSAAGVARQVFAPGPTPSQAAMGQEAWEELQRDLSPLHREIVVRLRDGQSRRQIAEDLNVSLKLIHRLITRLEFGDEP